MRKTDVLDYFGSVQAVATVLQIHRQTVYQWPALVPEGKAARLEKLTDGALRYDPSVYASVQKSLPATKSGLRLRRSTPVDKSPRK
jgi:transcriptional repressor of cell division inhibition gene dicB